MLLSLQGKEHSFSKEDLLQAISETRSPLGLMRSIPQQALKMPPAQFLPFLIPQVLEIVESETSVNLLRIFNPELLYNAEVIEPLRMKLIGQLVGFFSGYYTRQQELGHAGSHVDPTFLAQMTLICLVVLSCVVISLAILPLASTLIKNWQY